MNEMNQSVDEVRTLRTVFLPISTDLALADLAQDEGRGKEDVMREAISCYVAQRTATARR